MNIFSTRERKYEIGVLTAIGMKKKQVAALFLTEILILSLAGAIIGGAAGAAVSKPVTKQLLNAPVASGMKQSEDMQESFGRENNGGGSGTGQMPGGASSSSPIPLTLPGAPTAASNCSRSTICSNEKKRPPRDRAAASAFQWSSASNGH